MAETDDTLNPLQGLNHDKHLPTGSVLGSALFHTDRRTWQQASAHKPDSSSPVYFFAPLTRPPPPSSALPDWIKSKNDFKRSRFSFLNAIKKTLHWLECSTLRTLHAFVFMSGKASECKWVLGLGSETWIGVGVFNMPVECRASFSSLASLFSPFLSRHRYSCICRRHSISAMFVLIEPIWLMPPSRLLLHNTWWQNTLPAPLLHLRWAHLIWMLLCPNWFRPPCWLFRPKPLFSVMTHEYMSTLFFIVRTSWEHTHGS